MKNILKMIFIFIFGFITYGWLERLSEASKLQKSYVQRQASSIRLREYAKHLSNIEELKGIIDHDEYMYLPFEDVNQILRPSGEYIYPVVCDRSIKMNSELGVNVLLSNGEIIWDANGQLLKFLVNTNDTGQ